MTPFYRLSGGGNDFLALVEPKAGPSEAEIRAWCTRGLSAGADGLFVLSRRPHDLGMDYFNADGRSADLCLNGTRCAVRLASHLGWIEGPCVIETGAGPVAGRLIEEDLVALSLLRPNRPSSRTLTSPQGEHAGWFVEVGVPHFVVAWQKSLADVPIEELGPTLRSHPDLGSQGANIDFVRFESKDRFEIRSFERGVEAETLACGTGVMACVAVGLDLDLLELPVRALTCGGFEMQVDRSEDHEAGQEWLLIGDARIVAEGRLLSGATALPAAPNWS